MARFDHYCGWVSTAIGLRNMRWFLAFLVTNVLMCAYGETQHALFPPTGI